MADYKWASNFTKSEPVTAYIPVHSPTENLGLRRKSYRPIVIQPWTLASFLIVILACIALLEVVTRTQLDIADVPELHRSSVALHHIAGREPTVINNIGGREWHLKVRQTSQPPDSDLLVITTSTTTTAVDTPHPSDGDELTNITPSPPPTGSASAGDLLTITSPVASPTPAPGPISVNAETTYLATSNKYGSLVVASSTSQVDATATQYDGPTTVGSAVSTQFLTKTYDPSVTPAPGRPATGDELASSQEFTGVDYFLAMYFPTLLAVCLQSIWAAIFAAMKKMEPFYRLSRPQGASAKDSFFAEYLSPGLDWVSLATIFRGHIATLLACITYACMVLVVILTGESMTVKPTTFCRTKAEEQQPCAPVWVYNPYIIRSLQGLLSLVFILVLAITLLSWERHSGMSSDPSSITSMASLLGDPAVLDDFRGVPPLATSHEVKRIFRGHRYRLCHYSDAVGRQRYGLVKITGHSMAEETVTPSGWTPVAGVSEPQTYSHNTVLFLLRDLGLISLMLGLFGLILAYYFVNGNNAFNNFFNSQTFGPHFLLTTMAVSISIGCKRWDQETRIMQPWYEMAQHPTEAETSVLASVAGTAYSSFWTALIRRHFFVQLISFASILAEALIIAVNGVPLNAATMKMSYLASSYVSLAILAILVIIGIAVILRRRRSPAIPRTPNTLANVWLYLCEGSLLDGDKNDEHNFHDTRSIQHRHKGMYYNFAYSTGSDGQRRWMIN